jgi:hypothetical protein
MCKCVLPDVLTERLEKIKIMENEARDKDCQSNLVSFCFIRVCVGIYFSFDSLIRLIMLDMINKTCGSLKKKSV